MDIFYSDSYSRNLAFNCFMFMPEISNRMVFVNGKHPRLPHEDSKIGSESEIYSLSAIDKDFSITAMDIGKATLQDPVLSKVHDWVMMGWPEASTEDFRPFEMNFLVNKIAFFGAPG